MDVRLPDGTIVTNVPDGITQTELMARLAPKPEATPEPAPDTGPTDNQRLMRQAVGGLPFVLGGSGYGADVIFGARQVLDSAAEGLAHVFGRRGEAADVNQKALDEYKRTYGEIPGSGAARGIGQGVVTAAALPATVPGGVLMSAAQGAGQGALASMATPAYGVKDEDYAAAKMDQAKAGAALGGGLGAVLGGVGKVLAPSAPAKGLMDEGITPTIGQSLGGFTKSAEEKLSSIPLVGDAIKMGQRSGIEDFNRAIYNRILKPLNKTYEGEAGQVAIGSLQRTLSGAYDDVLARMKPTVVDAEFKAGVAQLDDMLSGTPDAQKLFRGMLRSKIESKITPGGTLPPSALKQAESDLGQFVRNYSGAPGDGMTAAQAVKQLQAGLREMAARSNPQVAPALQAVNKGYAELVQLENAAKTTKVARTEGIVTPADYLRGIKQGDTSVRDRVFSRGEAMNQDFAQLADKVLSQTYPDSGSIGRGLAAGAVTGAFSPGLLGGATLATIPYLPVIRKGVAKGLLGASELRKLAPYLGLSAPAISGLLSP